MSSDQQAFSTQPGPADSTQICGDVTASVMSSDWYNPAQYTYNESYITPYPSSTVENQPWPNYARASVPDLTYNLSHIHQQSQPFLHDPQQQQQHQQQQQQQQHHQYQPQQSQHSSLHQSKDPSRPRSSPSTFGPSPDNIAWMTSSGLGIQYPGITHQPQPTPATSAFTQEAFPSYPIEGSYSNAPSPPEIRAPKPRRPYTSIAPNPAGISTTKRRRDDDDPGESSIMSDKRRKRASSLASADLNDDDRFLVQLKDDEGLPWKEISTRFLTDKGQTVRVATLQMRYKRLREKFRMWEEVDMNALKLAHDYWEKYKWEIISAKMTECGVTERWPARHCARKWQELEASLALSHATTSAALVAGITPALSQFSSPVEAPVHFAFMPLQ